jgi:hypothetical protein
MSQLLLIVVLFVSYKTLSAQHPFALVSGGELSAVRERLNQEPYLSMHRQLQVNEQMLDQDNERTLYQEIEFIRLQAFLFALENDQRRAVKCFDLISNITADTLFVNNPYSFGLTRAAILIDISMAYDLCFNAWSNQQRRFVADALFKLMLSVNANMGIESNNRLVSNWVGIRYASALFASIVLSDSLNESMGRKRILQAHIWDQKERLYDHIQHSHTAGGWFVESLGYQTYAGSFIWPAVIAFQNYHQPGQIDFSAWVPRLTLAFPQHLTSTLSIPSYRGAGVKPDLADDNPTTSFNHWPVWLRIIPEKNKPYIQWMHDYIYNAGDMESTTGLFYSLLFYDREAEKSNPEKGGYLTYLDETIGVAMFRNRFRDSLDIVATFNTSAQRFGGHAGPDNLSFRLAGLGTIWALGSGRTLDPAGQSTLFPAKAEIAVPRPLPGGKLLEHYFSAEGNSGSIRASGSSVGVTDHQRLFAVDYSAETGASAVVVVKDVSSNGKTWRMHTPGFNTVKVLEKGVLVTAPNGNTMLIRVPGIKNPVVHIGSVRYGGETIRHNQGIGFQGKLYHDNITIDIECDKNIIVVMTLQEKGKEHPDISLNRQGTRLKSGKKRIEL